MFRVALGHVSPNPVKRKRRVYSPTQLTNAYLDVIENKIPVHKAAKLYGVPNQTLRDRINGRVDVDNVTVGSAPLFDQEEEARLTRHIKDIATVGYGYTRAEVINLASEYAVLLQKREKDRPLTHRWFYGFLSRWPELKVQRPRTLSELRSKACSTESITKYFEELGRILDKYGLKNKPQNIYNVDEKGVQQNFKPTHVVSFSSHVPSVVISERSSTTTIIGCGNAIGYQIPPYFVFAGARMRDELLEGSSEGAQGTVSKSGWSNSSVFLEYLQNHFVRYAKSGPDDHILLLYDGHRSHISPYLVDWAKEHKIILFVLPPHTSHVLQPMDVGCFGAFSKIYSVECQKHQRNTGSVIGRYNVCSVACKAYTKGLSPSNLQSAFRKSGVYPYDPSAIGTTVFETNQLREDFQREQTVEETTEVATEVSAASVTTEIEKSQIETANVPVPVQPDEHPDNPTLPCDNSDDHSEDHPAPQVSAPNGTSDTTAAFFKKKRPVFNPPLRKERRSVSKVVAGKAITEVDVTAQLKQYFSDSQPKKTTKFNPPPKSFATTNSGTTCKPPNKRRSTAKSPANLTKRHNISKPISCESPQAGTSGVQPTRVDSDESYTIETDPCCVCGKFRPDAMKLLPYVEFTRWGECAFKPCGHWVHLKYCCPVRAIRRHSKFYCPCHGLPWAGSEE